MAKKDLEYMTPNDFHVWDKDMALASILNKENLCIEYKELRWAALDLLCNGANSKTKKRLSNALLQS